MNELPDFELDLCGESCPYPVIQTLSALQDMGPGQKLQITTDCPQAFRNVPDDATAAGHRLVGEPERTGARMTFVFERGEHVTGPRMDNKTQQTNLGLLGKLKNKLGR